MKKIVFIIAVAFVLALGFQSCRTVGDCPAYSEVQTETSSNNA